MLATRPRGSDQRQFLVRWSGYGAEDDSWEDEANILDNKMIKAFDRAAKDALPQPECAATIEYLARRVTHRSRVGTAHQVAELPQARELVGVHRGAQCGCARCIALISTSGSGTAAHALPCAPPRCHCGAPAAWVRQLFWCEKGECDFEWRPCYRPEPTRLGVSEIEASLASSTAALLTASAFGPMNAWCFLSPSDFGLGLYARVDLLSGQAVSEYRGPRLPSRSHRHGNSVLQVPGTDIVIDGKCENSPFECPLSPTIFANHSSRPNARLEAWPMPKPGACDLRQQLMLVCSEHIAAGHEIRIDYEDGATSAGLYWGECPPRETRWRDVLAHPPPPVPTAERVCHRLQQLQAAAASGKSAPWSPEIEPPPAPIPWDGPDGGDARISKVVQLYPKSFSSNWSLVATHVPGRSGRECRDRHMGREPPVRVLAQGGAPPAASAGSSSARPDKGDRGGTCSSSRQTVALAESRLVRMPGEPTGPEGVPCPEMGPGWRRVSKKRTSGWARQMDHTFVAPDGQRFNSRAKAVRCAGADCFVDSGDEEAERRGGHVGRRTGI